MIVTSCVIGVLLLSGCSWRHEPARAEPAPEPPQVVVVAPVLNLSDSVDWDPLKVTDILASELQSFPGIVVIPVNRTLAALALRGRTAVETPEDALELARDFNADATLVAAITEYNPYDPPRIGIILQWYGCPRPSAYSGFDPVTASRRATDLASAEETITATSPAIQVQHVFSAGDETVLKSIRAYAKTHGGHDSPYGWKIFTMSQEHFVRYCCWASISPMLIRSGTDHQAPKDAETNSWKQDGDV